ncbi:unnamed protein product [Euphydryas editha]|uniref:Reverse transcriptase domain-containing protein n=1 Tax=Euphydryas editha TaxID=104508 RepID=A0AAU9UAF5_EUPED|nr:unnamed protein product [Euphydryas editha]
MKFSKLVPLFKSGSTADPSNFRLISVLPTFSEIFEKVILNQLQKHFESNELLHNKQFGFTRGRSTTDAGIKLLETIFEAWDQSHDAYSVFCDLSKAFDCVQHQTLIRKLHHYGIRGTALEFVTSYLSGRTQSVVINGKRSPGSLVTMGVPQGSILGPFLFLVHINDLPHLVRDDHEIVLFADDTSLLFKVIHWFNINNLLLNESKTKCVRFTLPNVKLATTSIRIRDEEMELVDQAVFLGITLDSKLQWGPHIGKLSGRLSSADYAVKKIRQLTDIKTARLVYFSYFHSIMTYGLLLWGNAVDIQFIFILQKRAVRAIYGMDTQGIGAILKQTKPNGREKLNEAQKKKKTIYLECLAIKEATLLDTIGSFGGSRSTIRYLHLLVDHFTRYAFILTSKTQTVGDFVKLVMNISETKRIDKLLTDEYPGINSKEFKKIIKG